MLQITPQILLEMNELKMIKEWSDTKAGIRRSSTSLNPFSFATPKEATDNALTKKFKTIILGDYLLLLKKLTQLRAQSHKNEGHVHIGRLAVAAIGH